MEVQRADARVHLLASFEVWIDGRVLDLKPGSQRLVAFLALADRAMERTSTAFRLWPDKSESRAMANLRSALWRIRQQSSRLVQITSTHLRLGRGVWVDARDGVRDLALPSQAVDPGLVMHAELLPDWYDDWLVTERERLRQVRLHALDAWCRQLLDEGRYGAAIDMALRTLAVEPLRESAHRLVIEAHLAEGNLGEAIRHYESCRQLLADELGLEPSAELRSALAVTR
jgi:DNA-binding SARP family transcriptional activator